MEPGRRSTCGSLCLPPTQPKSNVYSLGRRLGGKWQGGITRVAGSLARRAKDMTVADILFKFWKPRLGLTVKTPVAGQDPLRCRRPCLSVRCLSRSGGSVCPTRQTGRRARTVSRVDLAARSGHAAEEKQPTQRPTSQASAT